MERPMADSNITKKALAQALKQLMQEKAFEKISVSDICEKCDMNRKSFYYHFKDKYDLVNWIFDTEFIAVTKNTPLLEDTWKWGMAICEYFYANRAFYRKALRITGQNSLSDHFREMLSSILSKRFEDMLGVKITNDFQINFFTDAVVLAFQRWMTEETSMTSEDFIMNLKICFQYMAMRYKELENDK